MPKLLRITLIFMLIYIQHISSFAEPLKKDTSIVKKQEQFYDSLQYRANKKKITSWIYDMLISPPRPYVDKKALSLDYFSPYEGKIIAKIVIKSIDVFGPSLSDTTRKPDKWLVRAANKIHIKSNLKTIRKQLLFKVGDLLNPEIMYENERIIRSLRYIKNARIIIEQDSTYKGLVNITVLTKDRFSFGATGGVNGIKSGDIELYNRNIFGIGHEISLKIVGHINQEPYLGFETFYNINNIAGKFLDIRLGYLNTYRTEGYLLEVHKPFYTQNIKWGYGAVSTRMFRSDRLFDIAPVRINNPLSLSYNTAWAGYAFDVSKNKKDKTQLVISSGISNWRYFQESFINENKEDRFWANHTLYLAGLTFTQRRFIQDQLIYSYGIIEDIPEGFKNEFILGYDANEFGDRYYAHAFMSNGNLLINRNGYLYVAAGIGGYLNKNRFEEGQVRGSLSFISKLRKTRKNKARTFIDANYILGIRRHDIESLSLNSLNHIRGFRSGLAAGKQRLNLKLEHVVFLPHQFYKFNMAIFGFTDLGIIGSNNKMIYNGNYYAGIGLGIRVHNENLVFETLRLRLAFYPLHPKDVSFLGFALSEQSKKRFSSFEPSAPRPMQFE